MNDLQFTIKDKFTSNKYLRYLKNNYQDYTGLTRYKINKWKEKYHKKLLGKEEPVTVLTQEDIKKMYQSLLDENLSSMNLYDFTSDAPLVSIIISNSVQRNWRKFFKDYQDKLQYPNFETIIVTDEEMDTLEQRSPGIIRTERNLKEALETFNGEYILFLNNIRDTTYGWLNQMMQVALYSDVIGYEDKINLEDYPKDDDIKNPNKDRIGAVGGRLAYHNESAFKILETGLSFKNLDGLIKPYHRNGEPSTDGQRTRAGLSCDALLVREEAYHDVGGLDMNYHDIYRASDLCLKLHKEGYRNVYCPEALLFSDKPIVSENPPGSFQDRWGRWLARNLLNDKLNNAGIFCEDPLKVALVVTEVGRDSSAGDYFSAIELGSCLEDFGWEITFQAKEGPGNWYDVPDDTDVLISFLEAYDPGKIMCRNGSLIKIAWARNWFERWVNNPSLKKFDILFASSLTACKYIEEETGLHTLLLPLATNTKRFKDSIPPRDEYMNDYCFTGSYWDDPRDIVELLDPESLPFDFKLFGKNWDKFEKFKPYYHGFIKYSNLPEVYASSKLVIDDVNRGSKKFGAVNSRVYDALASGALVITNGEIGAEETFKDELPYYRTKEDLQHLINHYLTHEEERISKIRKLQDMVRKYHHYEIRANTLRNVLETECVSKTRIAIKIPAPDWKSVYEWGDYYLALGLKKEFERYNCSVLLQVLPEWNNQEDRDCDVVLVLRGLSKYKPRKHQFNIMWNISHPDSVEIQEYNQYDHVFIASDLWSEKIKEAADVPVDVLLQCTDPELFYPDKSEKYQHDLLFAGNSRKVKRKILEDLLPTEYDLAVYGTNWSKLIPREYVKDEHIPNQELRKAYSSCKILLNDHWDDMRVKGFLSNRLFDGFASGAFIISDDVEGASDIFEDALITYKSPEDLHSLIDHYLNHKSERIEKSMKGQSIVTRDHTFQKRVECIMDILPEKIV